MKPLARAAAALPPQGVREIMELAWRTPDCIRLEVGEPDFDTPAPISEAARQALAAGMTRYTPNAGIPSLREAVAQRTTARAGVPVSPARVVITTGAVASVATTLMALAEPGDEVLTPDPAWPNYVMGMILQGVTPVAYPLRAGDNFLPDLEELAGMVTPRTKALIINTPGNPTGAVFPEETMAALVEFARRHDLYLISDEVYEDIVFDRGHASALSHDSDGRVLVISGVSKGYAMTGWRIGWVVAPPAVAEVIGRIQEPFTSCATGISQAAAEAALRGDQGVVETMVAAYRRRRDLAVEILRHYGRHRYTPTGAFYIMVDIRDTGLGSRAFALGLLEQEKVAVAPGAAFGSAGEGFVRVSLASAESLVAEGLERLCRHAGGLAATRAAG